MAKKVMQETYYTFIPSEDKIILPRVIQRESLMLITNVTTNQVIYNFSDPDLNATSYTVAGSASSSTTTIVLNYNCNEMDSKDKLQIVYEEYDEKITPSDLLVDAVGKMRVANPQSLIDTDFEYGTQPSKWETVSLVANYPSFFSKGTGGNSLAVADIVGDGTTTARKSRVYVLTESDHGLVSNSVVSIQETTNDAAEGTFIVTKPAAPSITGVSAGVFTANAHGLSANQPIRFSAASTSGVSTSTVYYVKTVLANSFMVATSIAGSAITTFTNGTPTVDVNKMFTYLANGRVGNDSIKDSNLTSIYGGDLFDGANVPGSSSFTVEVAGSVATVTTPNPHGLIPGTPILINGATTNTFLNGSWVVSATPTPKIFNFTVTGDTVTNISPAATVSGSKLYCKPDAYVQHTAYNGGVLLATGNNVVNVQQVRQSRRTFRYQSGKAIQFSTGTKLTPSYDITEIYSNTTVGDATIVVKTVQDHGLQENARVTISGVQVVGTDANPYNGSFLVTGIVDENTFSFETTIPTAISTTNRNPSGDNALVTVTNWAGSSTRLGLFNDQNGMYFEYDGQKLFACRRFSNKPIFGTVSVTKDSSIVTGTSTLFLKQIEKNQNIVIKGMTYRVVNIDSDTTMHISPAYRGQTVGGNVKVYKVQEVRIPQNEFNIDRLDGTGPSGYIIDPTKMQMLYIDYSWYGSGFIRYGLRATNGDIVYCHRIPNNNLNSQSYMRSGNLPARYEVSNFGPTTVLVSSPGTPLAQTSNPTAADVPGTPLNSSQTVMYVKDIEGWRTTAPSGNSTDIIGYLLISDKTNTEIVSYTAVGSYNAKVGGYPITIQRRVTQFITSQGSVGVGSFRNGTYSSGAYTDRMKLFAGASTNFNTAGIQQGNVIFAADGTKLGRVATSLELGGAANPAADGQSLTISSVFNGKTWEVPDSPNKDSNGTNVPYGYTSTNTIATVGYSISSTIALQGTANTVSFSPDSSIQNGTGTDGQVSVQVITQTCAPSLSHWGSSVIMDGTFDEDKAFQLNARMRGAGLSVAAGASNALLSIRIAPSVDNGIARNFGKRDVINTMQLILREIQTSANGRFLIEGFLNPSTISDSGWSSANGSSTLTYPDSWEYTSVGSGSLAQVLYHGTAATITGGDNIFSFYTENSGSGYGISTYNLGSTRELGTSILSGNGSISTPGFPNGPDVLTIVATNLETSGSKFINAKLSWTESQA
jgi:hypothetical protein